MKKVLFALPLLAMAILFAYCHKSENAPTGALNNTPNMPAVDRSCGDKCTISYLLTSTNTLEVCGVVGNTTQCALCTSVFGAGYTTIDATGTSFDVIACRTFSITNNNPTATSVSFDGGATYTVIPANGCVLFAVKADCSVVVV